MASLLYAEIYLICILIVALILYWAGRSGSNSTGERRFMNTKTVVSLTAERWDQCRMHIQDTFGVAMSEFRAENPHKTGKDNQIDIRLVHKGGEELIVRIRDNCKGFDPDTDNGNTMTDLGIEFTPSDHTWVGAKLGIFALSSGDESKQCGHADFKSFIVEELQC